MRKHFRNASRRAFAAANRLAAASSLAAAVAAPAHAATYTWLASPEGNKWNTVQANWSEGATTGIKWVDDSTNPHDAVFDKASSEQTIVLYEGHHVGNIAIAAPGYRFNGSGPLNIHGTLSVSNDVQIFTILGGNPRIDLADDAWLKIGAYAEGDVQRISGRIVGERPSGMSYPTNTHFLASGSSKGDVVIDSGNGGTNDLGTLSVRHSLAIQSGVVRVSAPPGLVTDSNGINDGGKAPLFVCGPGDAYTASKGTLSIAADGELATPEETWAGTSSADKNGIDWYGQAQKYAQISIFGAANLPNVQFINGFASPSKLTVGNGGRLTLGALRLSQTTTVGSEVNLETGGTLRLRQFTIAGIDKTSGTAMVSLLNMDGGVIYPLPLKSGGDFKDDTFLGTAGAAAWTNVTVSVKAGGARFLMPNRNIYCNLPLKHGTGFGVSDGGLEVDTDGSNTVFVLNVAGSDYDGPTVLHGGGQMQVRVANALPASTTIRIGDASKVSLNQHGGDRLDVAQTIARIEGTGNVVNNSGLIVTGGMSPMFGGAYGTLTFAKPCSLSGTLDITGDASGCGCVKFEAAGQSIADLTLRVSDATAFDRTKGKSFYKVVDAPNGLAANGSRFAATDLPGGWEACYEVDAVYLRYASPTVMTMR
ncbi:MAG: hypothetical protein ILM98_07275 [Kiritimatiellae bacterium]|nr:hypothetical protein [Kiritimatiellia bacterium]